MSLGGRNASVRTKAVAAGFARSAPRRAALLTFVKAGVSPRIWLTRGGELDRDRQL